MLMGVLSSWYVQQRLAIYQRAGNATKQQMPLFPRCDLTILSHVLKAGFMQTASLRHPEHLCQGLIAPFLRAAALVSLSSECKAVALCCSSSWQPEEAMPVGQVEYATRSIIKDDDGPDRLVVVIDACELGTPEVTKRVKLIKDTISVLTKVFLDRGPSISPVRPPAMESETQVTQEIYST
jgi:hypothetical protein